MKITIFGSNGKVGRLIVQEALARGHTVTAFVHKNSSFTENESLKIIKGDINDAESVNSAIRGTDAVISALGSWGTPKKDILSSGMKNIIPAMQTAGISRIISLTGHGARAPQDKFELLQIINRKLIAIAGRKVLFDSEEHIKMLASSSLEWTVLRSPIMTSRGNPNRFQVSMKRPLPLAIINRQAVANCMIDLAESNEYARTAPFIVRK